MRYFEAGQEEGTIMRQPAQPGSELTRLLERMQCAYAAAHQGLAQGTACQQCSDATWQGGHQAHQQRAALVGPEEARTLRAHAVWTAVPYHQTTRHLNRNASHHKKEAA